VGALPPGFIVNTAFQKGYILRNRVSSTRFYDKLPIFGGNIGYGLYNSSSIYSYDIHGNVDTLLHDYQSGLMAQPSINIDRFKVIAYQYDLISGKVNQVHYQPGMTDQLYHRYEYDAENRLTDVYITDRKELIGIPVLEEHDARYNYYKHGPLARTVLGQQMVQGIDYAYTLQGWLKGVNSDTLTDGDATASAIDAYRFSLNYFNGDYNAIGSSVKSIVFAGHSAHLPDGDYRPLFNGNISSMVVGIPKLGETRLYNYGYDQLNRLTKMDAWTGYNTATHSWGTMDDHDGAYKERIAYDGNGNILKYLRNGYQGKESMDSLSYKYNLYGSGYLKNNKLRHIRDAVSAGQYTEDIDSQNDDNYSYDPIGNLIKDTKDSIDNITWTVYGKIKKIEKTNGTNIVYTYDPGGNRISKSVISGTDTTTTWYVRDAQGNPMGVYSGHYGSLTLNEHHLYGSSRLGIWNRNLDMLVAADPNSGIFVRGNKFFELPNHLGNVLVTISDRKYGHDGGGGVIDYYNPDVVNANDYYPFGMLMPGRKFSTGSLYRYGFNGKEKDNSISSLTAYDYGFRIYNPAIGKFLSVDPLAKSYPWHSPYQFAGNKPIMCKDLDGLEEWVAVFMNGGNKPTTFRYSATLKPLGAGQIYKQTIDTKTHKSEINVFNISKSASVNVAYIPSGSLVAKDEAHTTGPDFMSAYYQDTKFFKKLDKKSDNFAAIEVDDLKDMAFKGAAYAMENGVVFKDNIIDFHGTQHFEKRTDGQPHKLEFGETKLEVNEAGTPTNYNDKTTQYFQLMGKFMSPESKVLMGACNADKGTEILKKVSADLNTPIYGHKSYSYSANLGAGKFYGGVLNSFMSKSDGNSANQGKYILINPQGTVSQVDGVKFSTDSSNAGNISEEKKTP
jgi:RHS repeat-associated protein